MTTPATASTGTTGLMPISGTSAAARITPVPNPPMPPTTAAPAPSAATAASVAGSSSKLARHRARAPVAVDGDVGERRLGDLHHLRVGGPPLGEHLDLDGNRGIADAHQLGIKRQHVADLHRLLEHE